MAPARPVNASLMLGMYVNELLRIARLTAWKMRMVLICVPLTYSPWNFPTLEKPAISDTCQHILIINIQSSGYSPYHTGIFSLYTGLSFVLIAHAPRGKMHSRHKYPIPWNCLGHTRTRLRLEFPTPNIPYPGIAPN